MKLEELDLSNKRVKIGSLDVIQSLSGSAITNITTAIEATKGSTYALSGDMKAFINKMLDDGLISPDEKKQLRRELSSIQTEYPVIKADALLAGVPEFSEVMISFVSAYNALYSYLYTELKVFDNMGDFTTVALRSEFENTFVAYYSSRDALKKAITDGLILKVVEDVSVDILATNEKIEEVRLGDIIDGAIKRASLETGVLHEMEMVSSSLFPNGLERQGALEFLTPRVAISEDMVDYLLSLVAEQEEVAEIRANEIRLISAINGEVSSRMASLEINFDSITQIVAEIAPLPDGQIANLTQITQTADSLDLLATTGRYNSGGGEIDSFSIAQMKILANRFALFVGGAGDDFDSAQWMVRQDQISGIVQNAIETDTELVASISQMVQSAESVQFQVSQLRTETIERIDDALTIAQAGMLISATEITLGVQNLEEEIQSLLKVKSDQIAALVQDTKSLSASILSLKSEQIDAIVSGGGATASLAMAVTLPAMIDATMFNLMSQAVGSAPVSAVYALTSGGFWTVRADSTIFAQKTLKNGLRDAGLLGSQIILDADEILMGGKVRAANIYTDEITIGTSQVSGLSDALGGKEASGSAATAREDLAIKMGYASWAAMETAASQGQTIISGGKIRTNLIDTDALVTKRLAIDSNPNTSTDFEVNIDEINGIIIRKNGDILFSVLPNGNATLRNAVMDNVSMQNTEMVDVSIYGSSLFMGDIDSGPLLLSSSQAAGNYHSYAATTTIYDLWISLCALYPENYTEEPSSQTSTGFYGIRKMAVIGTFGGRNDVRYIQVGKGIIRDSASYSIIVYFSDGTQYYDLTGYLSTSKQIGSNLYFAKGAFGKTLKLRDLPVAPGIKDVVYVDANGFIKISR